MKLFRVLPARRMTTHGMTRRVASSITSKVGPGPTSSRKSYPGAPCWSCDKVFDQRNSLFCNSCHKLQPLLKAQTYFDLLDLPVSLHLDAHVLERKFQALQRQVHPDMFVTKTPEEQGIAMARSAGASEAYQTLKDPLSRARYVLGMRGVDLEVQKVQDSELLMEVMEAQEKLDEISDKEELQRMVDELSAKVDRCLKEAQELLEYQGDIALVPATQLVIRAQYYYKLKQDGEKLIPP